MPARTLTRIHSASDRRRAECTRVVLYARVSSKDQEKEGFSIPAQLRLLRGYAANNDVDIAQEFIDVETAKARGRKNFTEMILYLKKHRANCRTVLVEKTDRLYRNPKDWVTLDELDIEIHFVKENKIISRDSRSSDKLAHGMTVVMAKHYIDNLSEETLKGMTEKARSGLYPSFAPVGYRNADGPGGKRILLPDADTAPVVTHIFERFSTGNYALRALVKELNAEGVRLRGGPLHTSGIHQILRKRIYTGVEFDWNGATYQSHHEPLVAMETWGRVQQILDTRAEKKTRRVKHDFAYTGLVRCGHCGCLLVGELKKGRYVYYHCTGNCGKCLEPYTRQETLRDLVIPQPVLDWLEDAVLKSDGTEQAAREQVMKRLQGRHEQLQRHTEAMYLDKLDGRVTQEFFDKQATLWCAEQRELLRKIQEIQNAAPTPVDQAVNMMGLMSRASELFLEQSAPEQRRLLQVVVEEAAWRGGTLRIKLLEPFEILRHSNRESYRKENENIGSGRDLEVWLLG